MEIGLLQDEVLEKIREACKRDGFADEEKILDYFKEHYGRLCSRAARREICLLVEAGKIIQSEEGGKLILRLS